MNRLTLVWDEGRKNLKVVEMHCQHPLHRPRCNKNLKGQTTSRTVNMTLRMIKTWVMWCATLGTMDEHKAIWKDVEDAARNGTLPLDPEPPLVFSAEPGGEPLVPWRWQQRR